MSEIAVIAKATAKPGCDRQLEQTMTAAVAPTHAEPGCLKYAFHRSVENPQLFVMIEKWASRAALDEHLDSAHIRELFIKLPPLLAKPMEIEIFKAIPAGTAHKLL